MLQGQKLAGKAPTPGQILDAFAKHLEEQSWCIDVSGQKPRVLHADSRRTACAETIHYEFDDWRRGRSDDRCKIDLSILQNQVATRLPRVMGSSFRPTTEKTFSSRGALMANTYRHYVADRDASPEGVALLNELARRQWPDEEDRKTCLQFFAHILQKPLDRPQWALLLTGAGGTGKSVLIQLVEKALGGRHSWRENSYASALKTFSATFPDNLLVTFDDAPVTGSTYEQLKHVITTKTQEVEIKGQSDRVIREVYARVVVVSNDRQPFDLSEDRRFFVPRYSAHPVSKPESDEFFREFMKWMATDDCAPTVFHWLMSIDLTDFDTTSPRITDAHRAMGSASDDDVSDCVARYVSDGRIVHALEVEKHVLDVGCRRPLRQQLEKALTDAGLVARRRLHPTRSGQIELWVPSRHRRSRPLSTCEIERMQAVGALA